MEYTIIVCGDYTVMIEVVNEHIREGWVPLGGVSTGPDPDPDMESEILCYMQAMTRLKRPEGIQTRIQNILGSEIH